MEEFWILIFVSFFATNSLDKAESVKVKLEETPLKTFDEIFGEGWWDKGEAEDLKMPAPTNFGQNVHNQIDRQNTHLGQTESNSTDQNPPLIESDHSGQIELNLTDQNPPLIESDHFGQIETNSTDLKDEQKRKIVDKFHAIKEAFKQKGKYSKKERTQIERKIAKHLKVNRKRIYEWKKEFGLSRRNPKNERKNLVEKFDQRKAELGRAGLKNSHHNEINEIVAKELGLSFRTIYNWKSKLGQTAPNKHSQSEQKELMKHYYEIKDQNPKISDEKIAKNLKIGSRTLYKWKKHFKRQEFHQNSVDGYSVEVNTVANV